MFLRSLSFLGLLTVTVNAAPNVLLLCIDDLRPELGCYGVDYIHSPNIDRLAKQGVRFERHYVQSPTCGASRFALLTGRYGSSSNEAIFQRAKAMKAGEEMPPSMPAWFRQHGYTTVSVGKVSHHPGGRGGADWDDEAIPEMPNSWDRHLQPTGAWQHPRGIMHGLANGQIRTNNAKEMDVYQSVEGGDSIYPDGLTTETALEQLDQLAADEEKPFFLAVGIIRPHLPFGAPAKYMEPYRDLALPSIPHPEKPKGKTTWHSSGEFMKYNRWGRDPNTDPEFATEVRRHYAACVSYADAQVGRLLDRLEESGAADNTIIVLWGDHGWHLGEHAVWGKHTLFEESLRSPLIVSYPGMLQPGVGTSAVVETIDVFPTLCELTGQRVPDFAEGTSLKPLMEGTETEGHPAFGYFKNARTIRTDHHRLIVHHSGEVELYELESPVVLSENIAASESERVKTLSKQIESRLGPVK